MQSLLQETFEVGGSLIYGRADDVKRISNLISSRNVTDVRSTFVSIVADRGTGRTTLLHLLHNALCSAFDKRKFICMPEKFDEMRLMRVIIESLTGIPCDITDLEVLEETLKEEMMDQRLLLLLDNFENKSQKCWDLLSVLLKVCKGKSAIVVTTTRKAVAEVKGPIQFYYMNNLSDGWCSMIFKQCAFNDEIPESDTELADIGKYLVNRCSNVILCIKVLGGLLSNSTTEDWWKVVLGSNFWDEVEGDIPPALRVSYEYLPSYLKQCLKYCSLFPKEYMFSKRHLVHLWSSQGFIEPGEGRDIDDIGLEYFDQLLSQSFFQPSLIPDMKKDKFVVPGLIHDLVQQLSKNEYFQFEGCVQRAPENICHLSIVVHQFQSLSLNHIITRSQNLQTFLVFSNSAFHHHISPCVLNLVEVEDLFEKFRNLVMLNLNNTDIEELPETFGSLYNLRYLNLSGTNIKRIPLEISNLIHLQTLEAKDCHYLGELPRTIKVLTNLRYLDVSKEVGSVIMPLGIGKLTNLRSLATFNVGMDPLLHCGIEELKDMEHLKGCLEISGLINVRNEMDAKKSNMRSKEHIETLVFHWSEGQTYLEGDEGTEIAEVVLESLYPTENLKEITIKDYPGNCFPTWLECANFSRLVSIIFDHCYNCERLPNLGRLQSLKFLSIRKMYSVQKLNLSDSEYNPENNVRFPFLEHLTIWEMYELVEWNEIGNRDFPALLSLHINNCPLLRNVPSFPSLVELSVYSCAQFLEAVHLHSLHSLRIEGLQKTKSIRLSKDLARLKKLEISHCTEPLSIEGLSLLNSLEEVIVFRCPQLNSHDILDEGLFTFEERGNTSMWLRKNKLFFNDELDFWGAGLSNGRQNNPFLLNKRKEREDLSSFSDVLANGLKKIKVLESQMNKEDHELVETTMQRIVETVQSSIEDLSSFSDVIANGLKKIKVLESQMSKEDHELVETTMQRLVENVGSSIAMRSAILGSNSHLLQPSEPTSRVGPLREPASGSDVTHDPSSEVSKDCRVSRERKESEDLSSFSDVLANGLKKIKVLESQMSKEDHERVKFTMQRMVENVQSSIAMRSAILGSNSHLLQPSDPISPVGSLREPASGSDVTHDPYSEVSKDHRVSKERKEREDLTSFSDVLANGLKKIKVLESQMNKEDHELVETTMQRMVETVQSSIEDLSSFSDVLANGLKKIKVLESQMSKKDHELVETTMQRLVENVQSSIAMRSAILGSNSRLLQSSEPTSRVGALREPASGSGVTHDPSSEVSKHSRVSRERKEREDLTSVSDVLANGLEKIKVLESQMNKEDHELVETTMQRMVETVQSSIEDLCSFSDVLANGLKKIKVLESQMSKEDHELVETTMQRLVENVQSSIAMRSAILGSNSHLLQPSEPTSRVGSLRELASGSGVTHDPSSEVSKHRRVSRERKKTSIRRQVCVSSLASALYDGYTWRKYGERSILGCKFARMYYRCTHRNTRNCLAIKQIQQNNEDHNVYDVVYLGNHTCNEAVITATPCQDPIPAPENTTYFSFMSPMRDTSGPRQEEPLTDPPSSSVFEPIAGKQSTTLSLSMSKAATSSLKWVFHPVSSSFVGKSETEVSDISELHSVDSHQTIHPDWQEKPVAFSLESSSFVAKSEIEVSDMTTLHSVDSPQAINPEFESDVEFFD